MILDTAILLQMVKDNLGIKSTARDTRLTAIINGIIEELEGEQGIVLNKDNAQHLLFITDYATWRFENPEADIPRHLQFRLHNLVIHAGQGQVTTV
jgi:hypothetical protein